MDLSEEKVKQAPVEGFIERPDGDFLVDDSDRIVQYLIMDKVLGEEK